MDKQQLILITTPSTWKKLVSDSNCEWPIKSRYANTIRKLEIGDELIVYLTKKSSFVALIKVDKPLATYKRPIFYGGDVYDCFIKVDYSIVLADSALVSMKTVLSDLQFTRGKHNWGAMFQSSLKKIINEDFNVIKDKIIINSRITT